MGVCILASSFWFNQRNERVLAVNQFGGQGNGFSGRGIEDPYRAPRNGEYERVLLPFQATLNVPTTASIVRVSFLYRLVGNVPRLWFSIPVEHESLPISVLVSDRALEQLYWPHVSDGTVSLFQKEIQFSQVAAFFQQRGYEAGKTITEPLIVNLWQPLLPWVSYIHNDSFEFANAEYILTTWLRPRVFPDGWVEFSRKLDLSGALRNEDGSVTLMLFGSDGSEIIEVTKPQLEYGRE